jgi:hypothetical protein
VSRPAGGGSTSGSGFPYYPKEQMNGTTLRISEPWKRDDGGFTELGSRLEVGGRRDTVWFRVELPPSEVADGVEPFVSACLLPAMRAGWEIRTPVPMSPVFLANLERIQAQFKEWDPALRIARIQAPPGGAESGADLRRTASFFSGGVDSFYTLLTRRAEVDELILVRGFDIPLRDPGLFQAVRAKLQRAADSLGKPLVCVATNLREFTDPLARWAEHQHGPALGAVAQLLSPRFHTVLIPGEHFPDRPECWLRGSQPRTDPLFSTGVLKVIHDGYQPSRVGKIEAILREPCVRETLRVCWENRDGEYNCCRCSKCLRNMAAIRSCGCLDQCPTFPRGLDLKALGRLSLDLGEWRCLFEELVAKTARAGTDPDLERALRHGLRRHRWRQLRNRWLRL